MNSKSAKCNRRQFIRSAGAAGLGALLGVGRRDAAQAASKENLQIPRRTFGATGVEVPILSLGGMFDTPSNLLLLRQAVRWGLTYWDTAHSYGGGRSEEGIGAYFQRYPADREKIFLVTKSGAWTLKGMREDLDQSLERMQTDYIDLFFVHAVSDIGTMDDEMRRWAESVRQEGKIRLIGFSTHRNMEECLRGAAELGWIDGIMFTYNFRLMHQTGMNAAVEACHRAGIGLTAMKTQGGGPVKTTTPTEIEMAGRFLQRGFTDGQAKLLAVWEDHRIASICSQMPNLNLLQANCEAAASHRGLVSTERRMLQAYARETCSDYCAGCAGICEAAVDEAVPIAEVMRCLMYSRSYGEPHRGRAYFQRLPSEVRRRMALIDYSDAERRCPQRMAIGRLMREAARELA
jgi:predicted aldo/keto reductase-like oxidoreductase